LFRHFSRGRSDAVLVRRVFNENHPAKETYGKKAFVPLLRADFVFLFVQNMGGMKPTALAKCGGGERILVIARRQSFAKT